MQARYNNKITKTNIKICLSTQSGFEWHLFSDHRLRSAKLWGKILIANVIISLHPAPKSEHRVPLAPSTQVHFYVCPTRQHRAPSCPQSSSQPKDRGDTAPEPGHPGWSCRRSSPHIPGAVSREQQPQGAGEIPATLPQVASGRCHQLGGPCPGSSG